MNVDKMNLKELIIYFRRLTTEEFQENIYQFTNLNMEKFCILFLNVNNNIKKNILNSQYLFDKVMNISQNRNGKLIIELVDDEIKDYILKNHYLKKSIPGKQIILKYLSKLNYNKFNEIIQKYNLDYLKEEISKEEILDQHKISEYTKTLIDQNKDFNPIYLIKIKNKYELFIYSKFNVLIDIKENKGNLLYFDDNIYLDYNFLINVNKKHINNLIQILKNKNNNYNNNELFISIIKIYMIFGYDNSKKIIEDFYTYSTKSSQTRASFELFKDTRREFRLQNQEKYYYYGMENDILKALTQNDKTIFKNICLEDNDTYIENFITKLCQEIKDKSSKEKKEIIKTIIINEINHREKYYRDLDISKYQKYYTLTSRKKPLKVTDLYNIFKNINISTKLNDKGQVITDKELTKFLLGNCKRDNDCLLRLVINKQALGLNNELYNIINNFAKIKKCIAKNKELSLYSLLDIIDISKTFLYNLKPNELDITLDTLSKILNSRKYLKESPEEIVKRVLQLHQLRKNKVWSTIPSIHGQIDNCKYEIAKFDDESLLTCGIDGGDCLKVGGEGEEFLKYCLTDPNGAIMYLYYNNIKYILPCSRNGNMININSIDPRLTDPIQANEIITLVAKIANIWTNDPNNNIELVTITDIHIEKYIQDLKYPKITFSKPIPLNTNIYTDYNKKDVTNYIISTNQKTLSISYENPNERFYQERSLPYIYISNHEFDKERIEIIINNICYSSINYQYQEQKFINYYKENYELLNVSDYLYIVGNKDWFIAIDKNYEVHSYLLPYDNRALLEFNEYKNQIQNIVTNIKNYSKKKIKKH